jgi:hypothetical protein
MKELRFCRSCGYLAHIVAEPDDKVGCPDCHRHCRPEAVLRRHDVVWLKAEGGYWPAPSPGSPGSPERTEEQRAKNERAKRMVDALSKRKVVER